LNGAALHLGNPALYLGCPGLFDLHIYSLLASIWTRGHVALIPELVQEEISVIKKRTREVEFQDLLKAARFAAWSW